MIPEGEEVPVSFTSQDVRLEPILQNGAKATELFDYAVYVDDQ